MTNLNVTLGNGAQGGQGIKLCIGNGGNGVNGEQNGISFDFGGNDSVTSSNPNNVAYSSDPTNTENQKNSPLTISFSTAKEKQEKDNNTPIKFALLPQENTNQNDKVLQMLINWLLSLSNQSDKSKAYASDNSDNNEDKGQNFFASNSGETNNNSNPVLMALAAAISAIGSLMGQSGDTAEKAQDIAGSATDNSGQNTGANNFFATDSGAGAAAPKGLTIAIKL